MVWGRLGWLRGLLVLGGTAAFLWLLFFASTWLPGPFVDGILFALVGLGIIGLVFLGLVWARAWLAALLVLLLVPAIPWMLYGALMANFWLLLPVRNQIVAEVEGSGSKADGCYYDELPLRLKLVPTDRDRCVLVSWESGSEPMVAFATMPWFREVYQFVYAPPSTLDNHMYGEYDMGDYEGPIHGDWRVGQY